MRNCPTLMLALVLAGGITSSLSAQPKPKNDPFADKDYKRLHQGPLKKLTEGKANEAIDDLLKLEKELPKDEETQYMLALALGQIGEMKRAEDAMRKAVELGLPPGRFLAGPSGLTQPLFKTATYRQFSADHYKLPVHGPMLGNITPTSVDVWIRLGSQADAAVIFNEAGADPEASRTTKYIEPADDSGGTLVFNLDKLKPDTEYRYTVHVEGVSVVAPPKRPTFSFRTPPAEGKPFKFSIAFGGGAGYTPQFERMWDTIAKQKPSALLMLGDNEYIDAPTLPEMHHYCYARRFSRPEWRRLVSSTPVYAIYDDHDFGTNDSWGGPEIEKPMWKRKVWEIFKQNWVNPSYGGGNDNPGCWFDFHLGDVHFIMLDCRYYRTNPKDTKASMLGPVQKAWLLETLKKSKGTFRVICSSVPWVYEAKGDSLDTWNGYKAERTEIFDFLAAKKIAGVVLLSADRHRSDLWKIERPNGYALYEFNSSRLTNIHKHPEMKNAIFSYNQSQSFGLVTFDLTQADPTVNYAVININGEKVHDVTVKKSELKH